MKSIVIAASLALASSLALAQATTGQGQGTTTSQQRSATPSTANSQLSKSAAEHWKQHSSDGHMDREKTMGYMGEDGKPYMRDGRAMDFSQVDTNGDGRVSEQEWMSYHGSMSGGATGSTTTPPSPGTTGGSSGSSGGTTR